MFELIVLLSAASEFYSSGSRLYSTSAVRPACFTNDDRSSDASSLPNPGSPSGHPYSLDEPSIAQMPSGIIVTHYIPL